MKQSGSTPLTIYKASAGSGKTFTLAVNYIKILILNPGSYKNILAVTFTNKATEEMKLRILSQLYGIWKGLPDSQSYLEKITSELDVSAEYVAQQAGIALNNLLHNYNYFRVETIDTFFQSVLRNLARELDLTANLHIGLNDYQIEQQAVDELIEGLQTSSKILGWIMSYIKQNISDDKNWNVIGKIKKFGENIFKDSYKSNYKKLNQFLSDEQAYERYVKTIRTIEIEAKAKLEDIAVGFDRILSDNHLEIKDFAYGTTGVCGYFEKIKKGVYDTDKLLTARVTDALADPNNWVNKAERDGDGYTLTVVREQLFDYLLRSEEVRKKQLKLYKSARLTLRHLDQLRLLESIEKRIREINTDSNRFLLSDTQTLLNSLIQDNDSPFIFEKIGTQLEHIMIDEFQDTSTIQWKNFKVLLQECMSHQDSQNLIVGDVKQSIYRWRSGDWRLLNDIEKEFTSAPASFKVERMTMNYRSERNVIDFNNAFFTVAANLEYQTLAAEDPEGAKQLQTAYQDVVQTVPERKCSQGLVQVELFSSADSEERMLARIRETIVQLIDQKAQPKDIAILVRDNNTIGLIADYLMQTLPDVQIISDEAFKLRASLGVNIIIDALKVLIHPTDKLLIANLVKAYQTHILGKNISDRHLFLDDKELTSYLPEAFWQRRVALSSLPIYTLVEHIYNAFQLNTLKDESAYICTFYDRLSKFLTETSADIDALLEEWETNMMDKAIQSDELNGVRLITIHKSKGLEFDHTIVPFCDWTIEKTGTTLWCSPDSSPFNQLPLIPVDFNPKQMKESIFEEDYLQEHLQNRVDNMNLLYVAFTRAGKNLFVYGKIGKSNTRSAIIQQSLNDVHDRLPESVLQAGSDEYPDDISFSYGNLYVEALTETKSVTPTNNVFNVSPKPVTIEINAYQNKAQFVQSNKSLDFINGKDDSEQQGYITLGNVLHNIFARIRTLDDVPSVLQQLEFDGILYDNMLTKDKLLSLLKARFEDERVKAWFAPKWTLFNECSILSVDPLTNQVVEHRPDRVITDGNEMIVIDFKFGKPKDDYHDQIHNYMALLLDMGYTRIKGFLWFVYSNKIVEVK